MNGNELLDEVCCGFRQDMHPCRKVVKRARLCRYRYRSECDAEHTVVYHIVTAVLFLPRQRTMRWDLTAPDPAVQIAVLPTTRPEVLIASVPHGVTKSLPPCEDERLGFFRQIEMSRIVFNMRVSEIELLSCSARLAMLSARIPIFSAEPLMRMDSLSRPMWTFPSLRSMCRDLR